MSTVKTTKEKEKTRRKSISTSCFKERRSGRSHCKHYREKGGREHSFEKKWGGKNANGHKNCLEGKKKSVVADGGIMSF